jgi:hypothetical protein
VLPFQRCTASLRIFGFAVAKIGSGSIRLCAGAPLLSWVRWRARRASDSGRSRAGPGAGPRWAEPRTGYRPCTWHRTGDTPAWCGTTRAVSPRSRYHCRPLGPHFLPEPVMRARRAVKTPQTHQLSFIPFATHFQSPRRARSLGRERSEVCGFSGLKTIQCHLLRIVEASLGVRPND